ncbi:MAG: PfkB family carbohydrate kinase [Opitutales bacterium]|nr:PfkB family carbohydrate kinase [Opitutales bacterium]
MNRSDLQLLLEKIKSVRAAVFGDFCLDAYWFLEQDKSERSVETNLDIEFVRTQKHYLGGAANLAANIAGLGIDRTFAIGVVGSDIYGDKIKCELIKAGIDTEHLSCQKSDWNTNVYFKRIHDSREKNRIDLGAYNKLSSAMVDQLLESIETVLNEVDVLLINQQCKTGLFTACFRNQLEELITKHTEKTVFVDSRDYAESFKAVPIKINAQEACRIAGFDDPGGETNLDRVKEASELLFKLRNQPVFVTCGINGAVVSDDSGTFHLPGLQFVDRLDTVGAGDSFYAGASVVTAAGFDAVTSAKFGNFVAGVTVQKLFQPGTSSPLEVMELYDDHSYLYETELAEDIRKAFYINGSEIEIVRTIDHVSGITHAIFDHDGTISTLREGWEKIMEPMMVKSILGEQYEYVDRSSLIEVTQAVKELIDRSTGIQTLAQMQMLIDLIKDFGFVNADQIQDMHGYKRIYNKELMKKVKTREERFNIGEFDVEDFTLKNAPEFLSILHQKGIELYLASGTDIDDVIHEAELLGYAHLFQGRIYGSIGDIKKEAKKIVMKQIMDSIDTTNFGQIVVFGDGPVEIKEARRCGALAVGLASDEPRRHGLNLSKRTRLIRAGANIVIPDFSQMEKLLRLLNI